MYLAFISTPWVHIITLEQYHQLRGLGIDIPDLELKPFYFEVSD